MTTKSETIYAIRSSTDIATVSPSALVGGTTLFSSKHSHRLLLLLCFPSKLIVDAEVIAEQEELSETLSRFRKLSLLYTLNC